MIRLLGLDPGFAAIGWAVVETDPDAGDRLVAAGVVRTKKAKPKQSVSASIDNFRRAQEIGRALGALALDHRVDVVCAEAMSFPRSSSVAAKMAMCWGVLAQLCQVLRVRVVQASPQEIKRALTGRTNATKDDVGAAVSLRFPDCVGIVGPLPRGLDEHAYDAVGAAVACMQRGEVRALEDSAPLPPAGMSTEGTHQKGAEGGAAVETPSEGNQQNRQKVAAYA
ncbi:MAG: crossover junction endodeoxyribonuclease RuvC [Deltaproteobacteria bacterium]|nr:crossover junction endodeoxyribonuclease RuvC [Deltaproteobacteria bacterium]